MWRHSCSKISLDGILSEYANRQLWSSEEKNEKKTWFDGGLKQTKTRKTGWVISPIGSSGLCKHRGRTNQTRSAAEDARACFDQTKPWTHIPRQNNWHFDGYKCHVTSIPILRHRLSSRENRGTSVQSWPLWTEGLRGRARERSLLESTQGSTG